MKPWIWRNPVKVLRKVEGDVVTVRAARLDGSGPLKVTTIGIAEEADIAQAMLGPAVGDVLRGLRLAHGLTQEQTAEALDCTREAVTRSETGYWRRCAWMPALCSLWGVDMDQVLHGPRLRRSSLQGDLRERLADWIRINGMSELEASRLIGIGHDQLRRVGYGKPIRQEAIDRIEAAMDACRSDLADDAVDGLDDGAREGGLGAVDVAGEV